MKVLKGKEITYDLIQKLDKLDEESYEVQYLEDDLYCEDRFNKEKEQYIIIMEGEEPAGYINFFPTTSSLKDDILIRKRFRDVDITGEEVDNWSDSNDVFVMSIVIGVKYRYKENIQLLFDSFIEFLNDKEKEGKIINSVYCITVSKDGEKVFKRKMFRVIGKIKDNEHIREVSGKQLRLFLEGEDYHKSYKDDFFMFLPYIGTENTMNLIKKHNDNSNKEIQRFINKIIDRMNYEYNEVFVKELEFNYIGKVNLLNTYDIYEEDFIIENTEAFMLLISHKQSNMHVLALNLLNNEISSTLMADRLSQDKIIIYNNDKIEQLNDFMNKNYELIKSGKNRLLDFMDRKPKDSEELFNLLSSESYNSTMQQFSLNTDNFIENKRDITEAYDKYNIYTSERSVVLVADGDDVLEDKEELIRVYYSLVVFAIFQNISLYRITEKITEQLSKTGDLSYDELTSIYRDYALAAGFWDLDGFKYISTKKEAEIIEKSFGNIRMYNNFKEKLRFIDQVTDLNEAKNDRSTSIILGLLALFLAIFETQEAVLALINAFISNFTNVELNGVQFDTGVIALVIVGLIIFRINLRKKKRNK